MGWPPDLVHFESYFKSQEIVLESPLANSDQDYVGRGRWNCSLEPLCITANNFKALKQLGGCFLPSSTLLFPCVCIKLALSHMKTVQYKSQRVFLVPIPTASVRTNGNQIDKMIQ